VSNIYGGKMNLQYKKFSGFYDLVDVIYFNHLNTNPRDGLLDFIPDQKLKILEVCTGTAANSIVIAGNRTNAEIVGIDLSEEMLEIAKDKIRRRGIKNIETLVMDATNMSFDDNFFDVVLISLVLHEVNNYLRVRIINEAKRVLRNNGKMIIVEWDKPKKISQRILFGIIELSEPKGFMEFLEMDMEKYLTNFSLKVIRKSTYDYTRIFEITKTER
jgi:Methylase involved in ubiquinone/menaquinone biosynthesis